MKLIKNIVAIFVLFALIGSCTLNSEQEASLSESTTRYLEARRNGAVLAFVSMHHPEVVRYYKEKGDSIFINKFTIKPTDYYLDDPSILDKKKNGEIIHVLFKAQRINNDGARDVDSESEFIAISLDNGKSWFYVDKVDYVDKSIARGLHRLLKLKN